MFNFKDKLLINDNQSLKIYKSQKDCLAIGTRV